MKGFFVRAFTGAVASTGAGAGKGSGDSVRCERGSHVVAKAGADLGH